jgi:gas vesicle protein
MILDQHLQTVGIYTSAQKAVEALDGLILKGFPLVKIFLLGPSDVAPQKSLEMSKLIKQERFGTVTGTINGLTKGFFLGNMTGSVVGIALGLGLLCLPGLGQVALSWAIIFTAISSGMGTVTGGIIGSLIALGLSEAQMKEYNNLISQGKFLIVIEGTKEEIASAREILRAQKGQRSL